MNFQFSCIRSEKSLWFYHYSFFLVSFKYILNSYANAQPGKLVQDLKRNFMSCLHPFVYPMNFRFSCIHSENSLRFCQLFFFCCFQIYFEQVCKCMTWKVSWRLKRNLFSCLIVRSPNVLSVFFLYIYSERFFIFYYLLWVPYQPKESFFSSILRPC